MNIIVVFNSGYGQVDSTQYNQVYYKVDEAGTLNIYKYGSLLIATYAHKIWRTVSEV